jgi:hypothetical protein
LAQILCIFPAVHLPSPPTLFQALKRYAGEILSGAVIGELKFAKIEGMSNLFEWKRFWCPRGATINPSDDGFLSDPDSEYGKFTNPELVAFESLATTPALALLGEPGIGKSSTLEAELAHLDSPDKNQSTFCHKIDLRGSAVKIVFGKRSFEGEEIKKWRNDDYILTLFLDSFPPQLQSERECVSSLPSCTFVSLWLIPPGEAKHGWNLKVWFVDERPSAGCCGGIGVGSASYGCEYRQGNKCEGQYPSAQNSATH